MNECTIMYIGLSVKLGVTQAPHHSIQWEAMSQPRLQSLPPKGKLLPDPSVRGPLGEMWPWEDLTARTSRRQSLRGRGADLSAPCSLPADKQPSSYRMVLGPQQPCHSLELPGGQHSVDFYVEGLAFPDASFSGLISLQVSLLDASNPVGRAGDLGFQALVQLGSGV